MRYILFSFDQYYPSGGAADISMESNDIDACIKIFNSDPQDYGHIYDTHDNIVVWWNK